MKVVQKFKKYFHSFEDVVLFLQIACFTAILPCLIKVFTIPQLMNSITPRARKQNKTIDNQDRKNKIVTYTDYILSRNIWVFKNTCLKRSLILYHFLRTIGFDVHICFGVMYKKEANSIKSKTLDGHAWLLLNGDIFLEMNPEMTAHYTMTYCFPGGHEGIHTA